jgi:hypothetical protein
MRRIVLLAVCTMLLAAACARPGTEGIGGPVPSPSSSEAHVVPSETRVIAEGTRDAQILAAVLRSYLSNPNENSFPGTRFPVVFILARTDPHAADPFHGGPPAGPAISISDQLWIIDTLADVGNLRFVSNGSEVVIEIDSCAQVRDGGILIKLGTPKGGADRVEVGINGFVACLGATWLTYVVEHGSGRWTVTGTTGPMAIS